MNCPRCHGTGFLGHYDPCPECEGNGALHCCDGLCEQPEKENDVGVSMMATAEVIRGDGSVAPLPEAPKTSWNWTALIYLKANSTPIEARITVGNDYPLDRVISSIINGQAGTMLTRDGGAVWISHGEVAAVHIVAEQA